MAIHTSKYSILKQCDKKAHTLMLIGENVIIVQEKMVTA